MEKNVQNEPSFFWEKISKGNLGELFFAGQPPLASRSTAALFV